MDATLFAVQSASVDPYVYASISSESEPPYPLLTIKTPSTKAEEAVQVLETAVSDNVTSSQSYASVSALLWIFGSVAAGFFAMASTGSLSARRI